ncbi:MAG: hypothetical protein ABMA02_00090 [Saprospiraceae bacterium]
MKVCIRTLLLAGLFLLGIFPLNIANAAPAGCPSGNPETTVVPPILITYTWTGTVSTDWHDPFNWSPMGTPLSGSLAGDDVVIPVVVSGNYPVVMASARARSISIASGASLTVNVGGTLNVIASTTDGVTNAGTLTNNGTMRVDSSANDGIVNQLNALISNSGSLLIIEGAGNRLENYSTVTNTGGTFTVDGGLGIGLINHPGATITNSGGTFRVQYGTNQRVDNYGTITNSATFTIDGASAGTGLINRANASIANNAGTFKVQFGTDRRVDNYGTISNSATFTIDGASTGEGLINRANASITNNGGTFTVSGGTATLVDNYSTITNAATFRINGSGGGPLLINRTGAKALNNTGTFSVGAGTTTLVENDGRIENNGTFSIENTGGSETLVNRDSVINKAGATFNVQFSTGRILKNSKYVGNSGTMNLQNAISSGFPELVINDQDAVIFNDNGAVLYMGNTGANQQIFSNHGTFQNNGKASLIACRSKALYNSGTGVVDVQDSLGINSIGGQAVTNENSFTLGANGKLSIGNNIGGGGIKNSALFVSNIGCRLSTGTMTGSAITNDAGAVFTNNCATTILQANPDRIANNGHYTHLNGSMTLTGFGMNRFMGNNGYAEMNIPFYIDVVVANYFYNSDTLILGDQCIFPHRTGINRVFENTAGAYLYSDAEFSFQSMNNFLDNKGKAILGPSSTYLGRNLSITNVIANTDSLFLQGTIEISRFYGYGIQNTGYTENSGSFFSNYTGNGILNDGGTFVNSGSLRLDSISNSGLLLQGAQTFTNTSSGTISTSVVMSNSIKNEAGSFLNEGEIELGVRDSMGNTGIYNQAQFTNKNLITIGGDGDVIGQNGIQNAGGGNLLNRGTINIGTGTAVFLGDGIHNQETFTNDYCAEINLNDNLNNSGTFDNNGVLNINTNQVHTNSGTFTNRGTVNFLQPGSIPGLINDPFVLTCPDDQTICQYASALDLSTLSANPSGGTYSGTTVSSNMFDPTAAGPGMHTITYTYTHYDGCEQSCMFDIEVIAAPVATATPSPESICSGEETDIDLSSDVPGSTFTWVVQSTSGNVNGQADDSGSTIAQTLSVNDGNPGTIVYRITPTGPAPHYCVGQTTDVTVNITANQITSITCPGPVTVTCASQVPAPDPDLVSATDLCGNTLVASHLFTSPPYNVDCLNRFQRTRWYQVEDEGGNTASCSQVITVYDDVKPNFTAVPANVTVQCNSVPTVGNPTATDGCAGAVNISYDGQAVVAGACTDAYTITRTWTATDACGNTRTATQRITVIDTQKPNFTSTPANVTVQCDAVPAAATLTATDNCDPVVAITYNGETRTNGTCANAYSLTRRWTAADNCGNTRTISQRITVVDNGKPAFSTFPANATVSCTDPIPPVGTATATDGCGSATVTYLGQSTVSGTCPSSYQIRRTWRATDACGNSTAATQTIQVSDTGAPTFTSVPGPLTIECTETIPPLVNPTATDACGGYAFITFLGQVASGSGCSADYTITRTWQASDLCGNSISTVQVITVLGTSYGPQETENRTQDAGRPDAGRPDAGRPDAGRPDAGRPQGSPLPTVRLQPNPTSDKIWIDLSDFVGEAVTVSIVSDLGQLVWEQKIPVVEERKLLVSLRHAGAAAGIYTLSVYGKQAVAAERVVLVE